MKRNICHLTMILSVFALSSTAQQAQPKNENVVTKQLKDWTVETSILRRRIIPNPDDSYASFSPDGKYFYTIQMIGDLKNDCNTYELELYLSKDVLVALSNKKGNDPSYLKPSKTLKLSSRANYPAITTYFGAPGWTADSKSILFDGTDTSDNHKLYLYNVLDGSLKIINSMSYENDARRKINAYSNDASTILFTTESFVKGKHVLYNGYPEIAVTDSNLNNAIFGYDYGTKKINHYLYYNGKTTELSEQEKKRMTDSLLKVDTLNKIKSQKAPGELKILVRQDVNTPATMVVTNGKKEIYLTEPESMLQDVYIATTKTIKCKMPGGKEFISGLTLPRNYDKQKPLPLVIQNYDYEPDMFRPEGVTSSGYATQALAANGFAVLLIKLSIEDLQAKYGNDYFTHINEEGPTIVEKIDVLVKMLVDSGLVDVNRVGLVGFSRGGYETLYAVTHPGKIKLAAAIDIEGFTSTFLSYLKDGGSGNKEYERLYKGSFWKSKSEWLKEEPVFNVDKVVSPLLLSAHCLNPDNINMATYIYYDLLGAFSINKKPLEFLLYTKGTHNVYKPRERYAAMTTTVDWMNFWLRGTEDPDPAKAEKYIRWRKFRKMQEEVLKEKAAEKN